MGIRWNVLLSGTVTSVLISLIFLTGCVVPVDDEIDYSELESIWQYLKAYSIYQWEDSTRVPEDPFAFSTAAALMAAVGDTLKGEPYTHYVLSDAYTSTENTCADIQKTAAAKPTVTWERLRHPDAVRISISKFDYDVTFKEFLQAVDTLTDTVEMNGTKIIDLVADTVIISLVHNGGGDIDETNMIVEALVPEGKAYLQIREREYNDTTRIARTKDWHTVKTMEPAMSQFENKTFFVEIDGGSASASEILIAALKEGVNAQLIGRTSYGKGIGQIRIVRRDRRKLQITFMQMRGITTRIGNYHRRGIDPDAASLTELLGIAYAPVQSPAESASRVARVPSPVAGYRTIYE